MEGVTEADEGDSGHGGGQGGMDKTGCDFGAGLDVGNQDPGHSCEV